MSHVMARPVGAAHARTVPELRAPRRGYLVDLLTTTGVGLAGSAAPQQKGRRPNVLLRHR
ncbi:MAG: hypothetical protein JWL72_3885 [Ilumatobacteraceae bacterium]|nr:hypothetical protein [Ilumatobacteraceae bacterium]